MRTPNIRPQETARTAQTQPGNDNQTHSWGLLPTPNARHPDPTCCLQSAEPHPADDAAQHPLPVDRLPHGLSALARGGRGAGRSGAGAGAAAHEPCGFAAAARSGPGEARGRARAALWVAAWLRAGHQRHHQTPLVDPNCIAADPWIHFLTCSASKDQLHRWRWLKPVHRKTRDAGKRDLRRAGIGSC